MAFVGVLACAAWDGLGKPTTDVLARCRVAQEANLALAALACDFGGSLADAPTGPKEAGRAVGRLIVGKSELRLCFDGGATPNGQADWASPDTVITYNVQSNKLVRTNLNAGTSITVAGDVTSMELSPLANAVQIKLTFKYRDCTRSYTIVGKDP
jgi:hypothetical protein